MTPKFFSVDKRVNAAGTKRSHGCDVRVFGRGQ